MGTALQRRDAPTTAEIITYDASALTSAFEQIPKPNKLLTSAVEGGQDLISSINDLDLGVPFLEKILGKWWARWAERRRFRDASWLWLNPARDAVPSDPVGILAALARKLRLSPTGEANDEVCRRLMMACEELADEHRPLARHIAARIADLQFVACKNGHRVTLGEPFMRLAEQLYIQGRALSEHHDSTDVDKDKKLVSSAAGLVRTILKNIGGLVTPTLSGDNNSPTINGNANIMVPIQLRSYDQVSVTCKLKKYEGLSAFSRACNLWEGFARRQVRRIFVVVSDTTGVHDDPASSNYLGFWIPDIQDRGDRVIPGAPEAFKTALAQRLVRNDLPPAFPVGDDKMEREWREYMMGVGQAPFNESMCLSIPVVSDGTVVAIVNINAYSDRIWPRLLSPSWRTLIQEDVAAWNALLLPALRGVRDAEERVNLAPELRTPF